MILPGWYRGLDGNGRRAFWSSYAGFCIDAMNVQLYGFILPILLESWHLSASRAGVLATVTLVASALGGWVAGGAADRLGRIRVLRGTIIWLAISTGLCGMAINYDQLLVARILQGLAFGAEWAVGAVMLSEIASPSTRGRLLGTAQSAWAVGWGFAAIVAAAAHILLAIECGWRATFFVGFLPAVAVLLLRNQVKDARAFMEATNTDLWHEIFSRRMRGNTMKGILLAIGTHGGYWAIATWWPAMLHIERGLTAARVSLHITILVCGSFAGYLIGAALNDRLGRRATLTIFAIGALTTVLIATWAPVPNTALIFLNVPIGLFVMGLYSVVGPILTELYPTGLRGSGMGFCYNVGRGIAAASPLAVGGSIANLGVGHAISIYVVASYLLVILVASRLKETRGLDLALVAESPS